MVKVDNLRYLRAAIKADMNYLLNAPLSLQKQKEMIRKIAVELDELDKLNEEKRKRLKT